MRIFKLLILIFSLPQIILGLAGQGLSVPPLPNILLILNPQNDQISDINEILASLMDDYKEYITNELHSSVIDEYNQLFYGLLVKFSDNPVVYYKICDILKLDELVVDNSDLIKYGLSQVFYNFKKDDLDRYQIEIIVSEDIQVGIFGDDNSYGIS